MCGYVRCPVSRNSCGWRLAPVPQPVYPNQGFNGGYNSRPNSRPVPGQGQPAQGYEPSYQPYGQSYGYGRK